MKLELIDFLYELHEPAEPYPVESCAEMMHGFRILDATDLDEVMKHPNVIDRKFALVRVLSSKDDVMVLVWAKILDEMGHSQLATRARIRYNELVSVGDDPNAVAAPRRASSLVRNEDERIPRGHSALTLIGSLSTVDDQAATLPETPKPSKRRPGRPGRQSNWRLGDIPHHQGPFLDRDDEWNIRSAVIQLFRPGAIYQPPPANKRPNRAPRIGMEKTTNQLLPHISHSSSVLASGLTAENSTPRRPKFHSEKGISRPLLLAVTGQLGVGKSTTVARIVSDDVFIQKQCGVGTLIWLNANGLNDEDSFFEEIAEKISFRHPRDSRLKLRDILPAVLANQKQAVLLVVDDATEESIEWFTLLGLKTLRGIFIFRSGETVPHDAAVVFEQVDPVFWEDLEWLLKSQWKSDLALPPGVTRDTLRHLAGSCQGLPLTAGLMLSLLETSTSPQMAAEIVGCLNDPVDAYGLLDNLVSLTLKREKPEFADRAFWLLAFRQGQPISVDDLSLVWNTPRPRTKLFCADMTDKGLLVATSNRPGQPNKLQEGINYVVQRTIFEALEKSLQSSGENVDGFVARRLASPDYRHPKLAMARPGENFFHLSTRIGHIKLFRQLVNILGRTRDVTALENLCREQDRFQAQTCLHFLFERTTQQAWQLLSQLCERLAETNLISQVRDKRGRSLVEAAVGELSTRRVGSGQTLLMVAARQMCEKFVKQLLESTGGFGQDLVDAKDDYGRTVLIQQASEEGGNADMVKLLLDFGADIEAVDNKKRTALHYVARFGCLDVCALLIKRKCELAPRDDADKTPLQLARVARHYGVVKMLEGYRLDLEIELQESAKKLHALQPGVRMNEHSSAMQSAPTPTPRTYNKTAPDKAVIINKKGAQIGAEVRASTKSGLVVKPTKSRTIRNGANGNHSNRSGEDMGDISRRSGKASGRNNPVITVNGKEPGDRTNSSDEPSNNSPRRSLATNRSQRPSRSTDRSPDGNRISSRRTSNSPRRSLTAVVIAKPNQQQINKHDSTTASGQTTPGRPSSAENEEMNINDENASTIATSTKQRKVTVADNVRLQRASKIKICARRGEIPEHVVYLERRSDQDKLQAALKAMCSDESNFWISVVTGDIKSGCTTLVAKILQQDDFIRDICLVDTILWLQAKSAEPGEEALLRSIVRLLQLREPSANAVITPEQRRSVLERIIRENLADRKRPVVLVIDGTIHRQHAEIASCLRQLDSPILKTIFIAHTAELNLKSNQHTDDFALLSSFSGNADMIHSTIRVKSLAKSKAASQFSGFWSKPVMSQAALDALLSKHGVVATQGVFEMPGLEHLTEIYVGKPSIIANLLYVSLFSSYFEQDIQESFYGCVEFLRQLNSPGKFAKTEANLLQLTRFIAEKEANTFKRKYYAYLIFDDTEVAGSSSQFADNSIETASNQSSSMSTAVPMTEEMALVIVWNPMNNKYDNDILLKALRKLEMTRVIGKLNYEVALLLMPKTMTGQIEKSKPDIPAKSLKLLNSLTAFREWFLATSIEDSGYELAQLQTQRSVGPDFDSSDTMSLTKFGIGTYSSSGETSNYNGTIHSVKVPKNKKRIVVANLIPQKLNSGGKLINRVGDDAASDAASSRRTAAVSTRSTLKGVSKPKGKKRAVAHVLLERGRERKKKNSVVAVLYYYDKVTTL